MMRTIDESTTIIFLYFMFKLG